MSSLIISDSTRRIIRAGRGNIGWPIFAILVFLFANAMKLPNTARIMVGGFLLITMFIGLRSYVTTLARIVFLDDYIQIVLAVYERKVPYDTIESVQIVRLRLTPLLRVRIRSKRIGHSIQFAIPGPFTPWGSLKDCSARLAEQFRVKGVQVIER
jgi:hypothetical protein